MAEYSTVRGLRMRATLTDECGTPATGANDSIVTKGFVTVNYSPETEDRDEILLKNAAGEICVNDTTKPELKWFNLSMEFCKVNPELFAMLTGQDTVDDYDANPVGVAIGSETADAGFALEVWTKIPGDSCAGGQARYGYLLVPWAQEGVLTDLTVENDAITFTIEGRSYANHAWGSGPYDVVGTDGAGTPGPLLDPLDPNKQLLLMTTVVAPPDVTA